MNVMAQAHKNTKLFFQAQPMSSYTYAQVFRDYLKQSHKEYKAMDDATKALIAKFEAQIKTLKALDNQGFIQVVGADRIVINAEVGTVENIATAPVYMNVEDARFYDGRCTNGKGEKNYHVGKASQILIMIEKLQNCINELIEA